MHSLVELVELVEEGGSRCVCVEWRKRLIAVAAPEEVEGQVLYADIWRCRAAYVRIRQQTSAVSIRTLTSCSAYVSIRQHTSAVSIRQYTSAYVSIRQHTSAYVSSQHTDA